MLSTMIDGVQASVKGFEIIMNAPNSRRYYYENEFGNKGKKYDKDIETNVL